jgi:hypothetical protein
VLVQEVQYITEQLRTDFTVEFIQKLLDQFAHEVSIFKLKLGGEGSLLKQ